MLPRRGGGWIVLPACCFYEEPGSVLHLSMLLAGKLPPIYGCDSDTLKQYTEMVAEWCWHRILDYAYYASQ